MAAEVHTAAYPYARPCIWGESRARQDGLQVRA